MLLQIDYRQKCISISLLAFDLDGRSQQRLCENQIGQCVVFGGRAVTPWLSANDARFAGYDTSYDATIKEHWFNAHVEIELTDAEAVALYCQDLAPNSADLYYDLEARFRRVLTLPIAESKGVVKIRPVSLEPLKIEDDLDSDSNAV